MTLPSTHRRTPDRPCEHMAIKPSGVLRPIAMISSPAKPSCVAKETFSTPSFLTSATFFSRYSLASSRTLAIKSS